MDPFQSSMPLQRIGEDGTTWWIGQVEQIDTVKASNRFKVRILGVHTHECANVKTEDLPWAHATLPLTTPYGTGGRKGATVNLEPADWVFGVWTDIDKQRPIILASLGQTPNAASTAPETLKSEDGTCLAFTSKRHPDVNPYKHLAVNYAENNKNIASGQIPGSDPGTYCASDLMHQKENSPVNPYGSNVCVALANAECGGDTKTDVKYIMGELFRMVQDSGGNIGDYLINKVNGELVSYKNKAQGYINKLLRVIKAALARIRGEIIAALRKGVDALVKMITAPFQGIMESVQQWLQAMLAKIGCSIEDIFERLVDFITKLIFNYLMKVFRAATCQIDIFVNAILNKIMSFVNRLLNSVLGPLQSILKIAGNALNIVGGALFKIMSLLGISCGGIDSECGDEDVVCSRPKKKDKKDNLDDLIEALEDGPLDYGQSVCDDARTYAPPDITSGIIYGGTPLITAGGGKNELIYGTPTDPNIGVGTLPPGDSDPRTTERKVEYEILDTNVIEGYTAEVTVRRSGYTIASSSIAYKTADGTATEGDDYEKVEGVLGFGPNQLERIIRIDTYMDNENDTPEDFTVSIDYSTGVGEAEFINQKATVTIGLAPVPPPDDPDPYVPPVIGPGTRPGVIPPIVGGETDPDNPTIPYTEPPDVLIDDEVSIAITSDKLEYREGEFITYTVSSSGIPNGTILGWTLFGPDITKEDIIGGNFFSTFEIYDNKAVIIVGIAEDSTIEGRELLTMSINGTGAAAHVHILGEEEEIVPPLKDPEEDPGFRPPTLSEPIVDDGGKIIEIPIDDPGDPYIIPPSIAITGQGFGAIGVPLLDSDGRVTEIRITQRGTNYVPYKPVAVSCVLDSITLIRPGVSYTSVPTVYVDGDSTVAVAKINDKGYVVGFEVIDRSTVYDTAPLIEIIGGNGYGAKALASMSCLDSDTRSMLGYAKIGTGRYVDCPT